MSENSYDNERLFRIRLAELRMAKGISCREMSLAIGQCDSYINKIENGSAFPSMNVFFYICDYLEITPREFYNFPNTSRNLENKLVDNFALLSVTKQQHVLELVEDLSSRRKK